jgi:hypothetical protein
VVLIDAKDKIIVAPEFNERIARDGVPETHRLVVTGGEQTNGFQHTSRLE